MAGLVVIPIWFASFSGRVNVIFSGMGKERCSTSALKLNHSYVGKTVQSSKTIFQVLTKYAQTIFQS